MFGLNKLAQAVNALAGNLLALAGTVQEVNAGVRGRLGLDGGETALGLPGPGPAEAEATPARRIGRAPKSTA
jgi:hypothetical protein